MFDRLSRLFLVLFGMLSAPALADPPKPLPLKAYGDLPAVEQLKISPDGQKLAILSRVKGKRLLVVSDTHGKVRNVAPVGDTKVRAIRWAGNEIVVVIASSTENLGLGFTASKAELVSALLLTVDKKDVERVFGNKRSIVSAIFGVSGFREVDGKWLGYFKGVTLELAADRTTYLFEHNEPDLFEVDLERNQPRKIASRADEHHSRNWLVDENGHVAATLDISEGNGKWDIENGRHQTLASGQDITGGVGLISLGRDGSTIIYSVEDDSEAETHWYEVPIAGGTPSEILANTSVDEVFVDDRNGRMLGYLEGGSRPKPVLFDPARQSVLSKVYKAFSNYDVTIVDWTPSFDRIVLLTRGNGDSGTYYLVDMSKMKADPIGYERPTILPKYVGPISTVEYTASDGLAMDGILTLPPGREAKNLPVILFPHGGPSAYDIETFDWWAQAFASRGYAVFQPNFRGSTNRGTAFEHAGYGEWGGKMQSDVSDGLAELAKRGIVDPKRACIMGGSYGGYAALAGVTLQHGIYRCAVAVAPVSDLKLRYNLAMLKTDRNKMTRSILQEIMGNRQNFDAVSPLKHADSADAPILLVHGKDDTRVSFDHSEKMADALDDAGKPYQFVVLEGEDHFLSRSETRQQMLEAAMRFVLKYNPPD